MIHLLLLTNEKVSLNLLRFILINNSFNVVFFHYIKTLDIGDRGLNHLTNQQQKKEYKKDT